MAKEWLITATSLEISDITRFNVNMPAVEISSALKNGRFVVGVAFGHRSRVVRECWQCLWSCAYLGLIARPFKVTCNVGTHYREQGWVPCRKQTKFMAKTIATLNYCITAGLLQPWENRVRAWPTDLTQDLKICHTITVCDRKFGDWEKDGTQRTTRTIGRTGPALVGTFGATSNNCVQCVVLVTNHKHGKPDKRQGYRDMNSCKPDESGHHTSTHIEQKAIVIAVPATFFSDLDKIRLHRNTVKTKP